MSDAADTIAAPETAAPEPAIDYEAAAAQVFGGDAPAVVEDKPEETAAPEPPKPDPAAERVASRIIAAKRADLRAAQQRQEIAAQRAELEKGRAELAELAKTAEQVKAAKLSPSKALELLGLSPKEFLESLATEHEPDVVARRAVEGTQGEVAKLQARIDAMEQAERARVQAAKGTEIQQQSIQAQEAFLEHVATSATAYPHLTEEYTPREIAELGWQVATQHAEAYFKRFGEYPDDSVIAEHLETEAKARAEQRAAWRERIGKTAPKPSEGTPSGDQRATQPEKGPSPRTLTSRAASEKGTAAKPWSQEWADEESLRILTQALKTG